MCISLFWGLFALCSYHHRLGWNRESLAADGHLISASADESEEGKCAVLQSSLSVTAHTLNLTSPDRPPLDIADVSVLRSLETQAVTRAGRDCGHREADRWFNESMKEA